MSFWDRIAIAYDAAEWLNRTAVTEMICQTACRTPQGVYALDCAAGTGSLSLAMAPSARQVLCTDLSKSMLRQAQKKANARGLSNLRFEVRDLTALLEPDNAFDLTAAGNILHLLPEPDRAVRELLRVTRPGGQVLLPTFLLGDASGLRTALKLYNLLGFRARRNFTAESYRSFLEGFEGTLTEFLVLPGHIPVGYGVLSKPL